MKREERKTLNALRKDINPGTINVEVPTNYSKEGRQEIHHMLTLEKGFVAVRIYWNDITECTAVHYVPAADFQKEIRKAQEVADIDELTATLPDSSGWTWNGYRRPGTEEPTEEETADTVTPAPADLPLTECVFDTDTEEEEEEKPMTPETAADILTGIIDTLSHDTHGSAWSRGVRAYAVELLEELTESIKGGWFFPDDLTAPNVLHRGLLNGASSWTQYSEGGCSLIYDRDIAERLCTPSELKKTRNGERNHNGRESWLDVQSRALYQAERVVRDSIADAIRK